MKKMPIVPPHTHGDSLGDTTTAPHHADHETGGADALTTLDAGILKTGTLDGDRLPAISTTKKGAVPATGTPADKFLGDDGTFQRVVQADVDGLKATDTPQFAGLGIGVAGVEGSVELAEGTTIGDASGPQIKYNKAAELIEVLDANINIGDTPTQPGRGGTWGVSKDDADATTNCLIEFLGKLYAGGSAGNIYVYDGSRWSLSYNSASTAIYSFRIFKGVLYAGGNDYIFKTADGVNWSLAYYNSSASYFVSMVVYDLQLFAASRNCLLFSTVNGADWVQAANFTGAPYSSFYLWSLVVFNGKLYASIDRPTSAPVETKIVEYNGNTWSIVSTIAIGNNRSCLGIWNGMLYLNINPYMYRSANGVDWESVSDGITYYSSYQRQFLEYDSKLLFAGGPDIHQSVDGETWTVFYGSPYIVITSLAFYGDKLYAGTGTGNDIAVYTDNTYVPAPSETVYGHLTVHGRFRPGDMAGVEGDILLSGGAAHASWLARGDTGEYVGGVTDGKPVYKRIPASDVSNTPAGDIEATNVQAAIDELSTEKQSIAGIDDAVAVSFQAAVIGHLLCYEGDVLTYENEVLYG